MPPLAGHSLYESHYQRFLRLFEDMRLLEPGSKQFVTPDGWEITLEDNEGPVFTVKRVGIQGKYPQSRSQWTHLDQVEKRLLACGLELDTAVNDKGRWVIRLTNVDGAEALDMVFSRDSEYFSKVEIRE